MHIPSKSITIDFTDIVVNKQYQIKLKLLRNTTTY